MPKCKNDPSRKYKGTEPSPKGLGYCAHSMKIGAVKKGKDGEKWEVKEVKNGSKRWMKVKNNKKKVKGSKKIDKSFNFNPKKENINHIKELLSEYDDNDIKNLKKYLNDKKIILDNNKINKKDSNKIISKLKEINVQNNIIKKIKNKINKLPKNIINDFNYLNITKEKIKYAIIKYVQKKYNEMSIFSIDIKYILDNKWDALTDTSVKEEIKILVKKNTKNIKNMKNKKYKTWPDMYTNIHKLYIVELTNSGINILLDKLNNTNKSKIKLINTIRKYNKIFISKDKKEDNFNIDNIKSNSILINTVKNKYTLISFVYREYDIKEEILKFDSIIIGNEVPFCYGESKNNIYLFTIEPSIIDKKYFKNIKNIKNIYEYYTENKLKKHSTKLNFKNIKYNQKLINNKNIKNIVDSNNNKLNDLLKKNNINNNEEEYITKLFSKNKKIMKEYFNKFIEKIYSLNSKKKIIKINKEICINDQYLNNKKIKFKLNEGTYEVFVNNYIKNISSMIIIRNKKEFNLKKIKFSKTNKILEIDDSQNIIISENKDEINLELKGKQFFGSYNIYVGKLDKEIKIIIIPLINFLNNNIIKNINTYYYNFNKKIKK